MIVWLLLTLSPLNAQREMGLSPAVTTGGGVYLSQSSTPDFAPGARLNLYSGISCKQDTPLRVEIYPLGTLRSYPIQLINQPGCFLQVVLPSDIPSGPAEMVLTTPDEQISAYLRIVPFALAIANDTLFLPGMKLMQPATPGTRITLQTTGAGNTPLAELQVDLGGLRFAADALRRSPTQDGIDELDLTIPANAPTGCYVPLRIAAGIDSSYSVLVSVMPEPVPCTHSLGLTAGQLATLDNRGVVPAAVLTLDNTSVDGDRAALDFRATDRLVLANLAGPSIPPAFGCALSPSPGRSSLLYTNQGGRLISGGASIFVLKSADGQALTLTPLVNDPPNWFRTTDSSRWLAAGEWSIEGLNWSFPLPPVWKPTIDRSRLSSRVLEWNWDPTGYTEADVVTAAFQSGAQAITCIVDARSGKLHIDIPSDFDIPASLRSAFYGILSRRTSMRLLQPFRASETQPGVGWIDYRMTYFE